MTRHPIEAAAAEVRAPRVEPSRQHVVVIFGGEVVADTTRALCVLEASQSPAYYIPPGDYRRSCFRTTPFETFCEWKGVARYFDAVVGDRVACQAAWSYPNPAPRYALLQDCVAIYPGRADVCYVDGERVQPQDDRF